MDNQQQEANNVQLAGASDTQVSEAVSAPQYPMKWHKFLIYFSLWAGALSLFGTGLSVIMQVVQYGSLLGQSLALGLVLYSVAAIALGIFSIYVRFQLARFRRSAVKLLVLLHVLTIVLNIVDFAMASNLGITIDSSNTSTLFAPVILIILNLQYYKKRSALFVN